MHWPRAATLTLALTSGAAPTFASALELEWTAPEGCPQRPQVLADIQRMSSVDDARSAAPTHVVGVVVQGAHGWTVELSMVRGAGPARRRRVEGSTCREVSDAAAVIIALALDTAAAEPAEVPAPEAKPPSPSPAPTPESPISPPSTPATVGWRLVAFGGVDLAALPEPSPGGGLSGGVSFDRNRVEVRASAWAPRATYVTSTSGADIGLYVGAAQYCRTLLSGVIGLSACGALEAGAMVAESFGLRSDGSGVAPWLAPELSLSAEVHAAKHLTASLDVAVLIPTLRDNFTVDADAVYRTSAVDGRVTLSIGYEAP